MIYTSYFGNMKELLRHNIEPVAISRGVPRGFTGRRILSLAPTWAMLKMSDAMYNREYEKILSENDREQIVKYLGNKDVALLCWEKDINDCHRKRVGEWLREGGYEVQEFDPKPKEENKETQMCIFPSLA